MSNTNQTPPVKRPAGVEQSWQQKVERAKEARREGNEIRKDKAPAFPTHRRSIQSA